MKKIIASIFALLCMFGFNSVVFAESDVKQQNQQLEQNDDVAEQGMESDESKTEQDGNHQKTQLMQGIEVRTGTSVPLIERRQ